MSGGPSQTLNDARPSTGTGRNTGRPPPDWLIEMGLGGRDPVYVHVGSCHMAGKRSRGVERDQALRAVTEGIDSCPHCRPDTELGVLD